MEYQILELKIISANNLHKSNPFSNIHPYVVVWISDPKTAFPAQKTPIAATGGRNPNWNHTLTFVIPSTVNASHLILHLQLLSKRALISDELVGELHIPLSDLLNSVSPSASTSNLVSYQVMKPTGQQNGVIFFSYGFVNMNLGASGEPVMGYPMNLYPRPPSAPPVPTEPQPIMEPVAVDGRNYDGRTGYGYRRRQKYGYPMGGGYWYTGQMGYGCRSGCRWKTKKCGRMGWGGGCSAARWRSC